MRAKTNSSHPTPLKSHQIQQIAAKETLSTQAGELAGHASSAATPSVEVGSKHVVLAGGAVVGRGGATLARVWA